MEFTKDCYWRTEPTEQITAIPAGLEQATRELSQGKIVRKAAGPQAQSAVAALDKLPSRMTRADKGQRLKIWGTVCGSSPSISRMMAETIPPPETHS